MLDRQPPLLDPLQGERLALATYKHDFWQRDAEIHGRDSWKLERKQHFEEQNHPSRDALRRGDWHEALELLEQKREHLLKMAREDQRRGSVFHRVRVVENPLTPYVQWELHSLRIQNECGMPVRVVTAERVAALENDGLLPEVVVLGGNTLYRVLYTDKGVSDGAVRFTDSVLIERWESFVKTLYAHGEDVSTYVDRCVAHLPPPRLETPPHLES